MHIYLGGISIVVLYYVNEIKVLRKGLDLRVIYCNVFVSINKNDNQTIVLLA